MTDMQHPAPSRRRRRGTVLLAATALTAAALTTGATAAAPAGHTQRAPQTKGIATSVLGTDYKVTLTAVRSASDPYAASVRMQVYVRKSGAWKESDRIRVGGADGWFWYPLTGRHAVGRFSTAGTEPAPVDVRLLVTPSIGYSTTYHYVIRHGDVSTR
ncbi:hypothetical protein ACFOOM_18340 [Streptomyces echinoruber]|nr:hypothetical protein [Streptomyces echinoruber]